MSTFLKSFFKGSKAAPANSKLTFEDAEVYRITEGDLGSKPGETNGMFAVKIDKNVLALVIVTDGKDTGWERVSVHIRCYRQGTRKYTTRLPSFWEMESIKQLFFKPDAVVMQLHLPGLIPQPKVLSLWRPLREAVPVPADIFSNSNSNESPQ